MSDGAVALRTVMDINRAQEELITATAHRVGVPRDRVEDTPGDVLEQGITEIINERFDPQMVAQWAHHQVSNSIKETLRGRQLSAIQEGDDVSYAMGAEAEDPSIETQFSCLINQLPFVIYHGYLIGRYDERQGAGRISITDKTLTVNMDKAIGGTKKGRKERPVEEAIDSILNSLSRYLTVDARNWILNRFFKNVCKEDTERWYFLLGMATGMEAMKEATDVRR